MLLNSDIFFTSLFLFSFLFFSLVSLNFSLLFLFFSVDQLLHISLFVFYCQSLSVFLHGTAKVLVLDLLHNRKSKTKRNTITWLHIYPLSNTNNTSLQQVSSARLLLELAFSFKQLSLSQFFSVLFGSINPYSFQCSFLVCQIACKSGNVFPSQRLCFWFDLLNSIFYCCISCLLSIYMSFASYSVPICNPILSIIKCIHNIKQAIFVVSLQWIHTWCH